MVNPAMRRTRTPVPVAEEPASTATAQRRMRVAEASARQKASQSTKQETGRVSTTTEAYGNETVADEPMETRHFPPGVEPSFVRIGAGKTINLGNYESLRIDVSVTQPCLPSEVQKTMDDVSDIVAERLMHEENQWLGAAQPKAKRK